MKPTMFHAAILITIFLVPTTARTAETIYDGSYWRSSPLEVKRLYVQGVVGGVLLGQDRVVRYGLPDEGTQAVAPECHRAVVRIVNTLERQIENWDYNKMVEALDAFYSDPAHRALHIRWAVMVVMLEMQGASPEEIKDLPPTAPE